MAAKGSGYQPVEIEAKKSYGIGGAGNIRTLWSSPIPILILFPFSRVRARSPIWRGALNQSDCNGLADHGER